MSSSDIVSEKSADQIAFEETFPQNISVSIVGIPLLSNICLETTFVIFDIK